MHSVLWNFRCAKLLLPAAVLHKPGLAVLRDLCSVPIIPGLSPSCLELSKSLREVSVSGKGPYPLRLSLLAFSIF